MPSLQTLFLCCVPQEFIVPAPAPEPAYKPGTIFKDALDDLRPRNPDHIDQPTTAEDESASAKDRTTLSPECVAEQAGMTNTEVDDALKFFGVGLWEDCPSNTCSDNKGGAPIPPVEQKTQDETLLKK